MLSSGWFETFHGTPEEKQKLTQSIHGSSYVLNILSDWIEKRLHELQTIPRDDYDKPNWELRVADRNGQIRAMTDVLKLTKLEKK